MSQFGRMKTIQKWMQSSVLPPTQTRRRPSSVHAKTQSIILLVVILMINLFNWYLSPTGLLFTDDITSLNITNTSIHDVTLLNTSDPNNNSSSQEPFSHPNCQIIYVVGVEGSMHHGVSEVIRRFASRQVNNQGEPYKVHFRDYLFRSTIRWNSETTMDTSPQILKQSMDKLCPRNDNKTHVIIEDKSFPAGMDTPIKGETSSEVASFLKMNPKPVDLIAFAQMFAPYANVKFVVLHRPFVNTVASHNAWHGGTKGHSIVLLGHLKYLAQLFGGKGTVGGAPWTLLCVNWLSGRNNDKTAAPRKRILESLSQFFEWQHSDCPRCFDTWRDSSKDPQQVVGENAFRMLHNLRDELKGIWPPAFDGDGIPEQRNCPL